MGVVAQMPHRLLLAVAHSKETATPGKHCRQSLRQETDRHSHKPNLHPQSELPGPSRMRFFRFKLLELLGNSWKCDFLLCPNIPHLFCNIKFPKAVQKNCYQLVFLFAPYKPALFISLITGTITRVECCGCLVPGSTGPTIFQHCQLPVNLNHVIPSVCTFVCLYQFEFI